MYCSNSEPTVEELLSDPVARLLMACDGLQPEYVWACIGAARRKLKAVNAWQREAVDQRGLAATAVEGR